MNIAYARYTQALIMGLALLISGTPALAAPPPGKGNVNARIAALEAAVATLKTRLAAANGEIATLRGSDAMALNPYLTVTTIGGIPNVTFSGINVQIVNGEDRTDSVNGTGNLIVGYNEEHNEGQFRCTVGGITGIVNEESCLNADGVWTDQGFKTGSHYIVAGSHNNYSSYGGMVFGYGNTSNHAFAGVSGGYFNTASGFGSNVSGGYSNSASGAYSNVSGGTLNTASGLDSNVSGGYENRSRHLSSSILGGIRQSTSEDLQTIP